jgi:sigma-B regulation protein RsbU (phosphoserine phosphatase)
VTTKIRRIPLGFIISSTVRYLLVANGFRFVQALAIVGALGFLLTGSRLAAIDRYGNRADIVASIIVTIGTVGLLTLLNRHVKRLLDRAFFRAPYDAQEILTQIVEVLPTLSKTGQLVKFAGDKISEALHPETVTIFLNDETANAYVAMYSSDVSRRDDSPAARRRNLFINYNQPIVQQLKRSQFLTFTVPANGTGSVFGETIPLDQRGPALTVLHASLLVAITFKGRLHGVMSLGKRMSGLAYSELDKRLLLGVANQIATFIENMKTIDHFAEYERSTHQLAMAAEVQRHLLPAEGLATDRIEIYGTSVPALSVGGDYYDYFDLDDRRLGIAIADVAGKGMAAALLMSTVQASLRCQLISKERSLSDVVSSMNRLLRRSTGDSGFVTFFLAAFDSATRTLTYVNAGHNPPIFVRDAAAPAAVVQSLAQQPVIKLLPTGGPIIGTFLNEPYEQETIQLQSGDTLLLYSDGVTEAVNTDGVEFGEQRLRQVLVEWLHLPAYETATRVITSVIEWQGGARQHDDITVLVAKIK